MFLHLSVCPQGGLSQCMLGYDPPGTRDFRRPDPPGPDTPRTRHSPGPDTPPEQVPPSRWLRLRIVRILLECILVVHYIDVLMYISYFLLIKVKNIYVHVSSFRQTLKVILRDQGSPCFKTNLKM